MFILARRLYHRILQVHPANRIVHDHRSALMKTIYRMGFAVGGAPDDPAARAGEPFI